MDPMEDKKIKEALFESTDEAAELKDMVWNNIRKELNLDEGNKKTMKSKKKKSDIWSFVRYGSIAAAVAIVILSNTEYGHAAVDKIRQMFAPNKVVEQKIEGMPTQDKVTLKEGSAKYIIYIDEQIYKMESLNGKDKISPINKAENYPEVYMEIEQIKDKKTADVIGTIEKDLQGKYKKVENRGKVKDPIESTLIYASTGTKWNDVVIKYYVVDNTKGGSFIIKQQFFLEASEGHGARLDNMLNEFKIISE
jgi:hypothetical protein